VGGTSGVVASLGGEGCEEMPREWLTCDISEPQWPTLFDTLVITWELTHDIFLSSSQLTE